MGYHTSEHITSRLRCMIVHDEAYLSRRAARGTHTPTDDAIAEDMAVAALIIELLGKHTS